MAGKESAKCVKCGITSKENPSLTFHRFPLPSKHGSLKVKVWAKFCYPDQDWSSNDLLETLHKQHKMLCGNHFDDSSFTSSTRTRLNKFAIPIEAQSILSQLRDKQLKPSREAHDTQCEKPILQTNTELTASTSQCIKCIEHSNENLQSSSLSKELCKSTGILKDLNMKIIIELTPRKRKLCKTCKKKLTAILRKL